MWADWKHARHRHYYVHELAQLDNQDLVIPERWVTKSGIELAEVHQVHMTEVCAFPIIHSKQLLLTSHRMENMSFTVQILN
jgi:hypothetical protein